MNRRELICSVLLGILAEDEAPANEAVLHAGVESHPAMGGGRVLLSEFTEALRLCERSRWVAGIRTGFKGIRWHITDAGRAELNR